MQQDVLGANVPLRKPNNPGSIPVTHIKVNGENQPLKSVLWPLTSTGPMEWNPNYEYNEMIFENMPIVSISYLYIYFRYEELSGKKCIFIETHVNTWPGKGKIWKQHWKAICSSPKWTFAQILFKQKADYSIFKCLKKISHSKHLKHASFIKLVYEYTEIIVLF